MPPTRPLSHHHRTQPQSQSLSQSQSQSQLTLTRQLLIVALLIVFPLLREIHQRLMEGVRGERAMPGKFRDRQNYIGTRGDSIENARFVPPPPDELLECLNQLEGYFHAQPSYPPVVRMALIHYQFEAIHPFIDGNGRIGRLLISLLTVHWNLLPLPLLYLSAPHSPFPLAVNC